MQKVRSTFCIFLLHRNGWNIAPEGGVVRRLALTCSFDFTAALNGEFNSSSAKGRVYCIECCGYLMLALYGISILKKGVHNATLSN